MMGILLSSPIELTVEARERSFMSMQQMPRRRQELIVFILFTVFVAPALAVAIVGGYGFAIWMYQLLSGPPTG
jgi:nitrate reductase NapE